MEVAVEEMMAGDLWAAHKEDLRMAIPKYERIRERREFG